jgi:MFS family permease
LLVARRRSLYSVAVPATLSCRVLPRPRESPNGRTEPVVNRDRRNSSPAHRAQRSHDEAGGRPDAAYEPPLTASAKLVLALVVVAVGVAQGFGRFTYPLVLPAIESDLLHSYSLAGWLGTANLTAYLVGVLFVSLAAARVSPARLIVLGLVVSTAGLALMTCAASPGALLGGMIATGIAGALIWIPAPGLAGAVVPEGRRGFAIGLMASGIGIAVLFAAELTHLVQARYGANEWRMVWGVEAALAALATGLALGWLREPDEEHATDPQSSIVREILGLASLRRLPGWVAITAAYSGYGLCYSVYSSYLVAALQSDAGFSARHASLDYGLVGLSIAAGGILLGQLSDRVGRRPTLVWGFAAMGSCPLFVLIGAEPWAGASALLFGIMMSGLGSVVAAYVRDHTTEGLFASAFGAITLFFGVAQLAGPELGGILAEHTGTFRWAFLVSAFGAFAGAAASAALPLVGVLAPERRKGSRER